MYKIGEFSKLVNISARTLRYYDEVGILVPNSIDKFTGYRMYNDDNIKECELVKLLKLINFSLSEIAIYKNKLDNDILSKKQKEIFQEIKFLKLQLNLIEDMKENLISKNDKPKVYTKNMKK